MKFFKAIITAVLFLCIATASKSSLSEGISLLRDEESEQILKEMSKPIFDQAGLSASNIKFVLVDNTDLNAFVAGGENIFVNTGLILETSDVTELLGVIAHETGHIASGHLVRSGEENSNMMLNTVLANLLGIAVAVGTHSAEAGMAASSFGTNAAVRTILRHSRTQEGSADQSGVRFLEGAGLPVSGLASFMKKLEGQELLPETQQSEYVRTHPLTQDRVASLEHAAATNTHKSEVPEKYNVMYGKLKAKLEGYLYPDRVISRPANDFFGKYARAQALIRRNRYKEALPILDDLIKEEPQDPYLYEMKGQVQYENGLIEDSIASYSKASAMAPFSGLIKIAYAHSLLESKEKGKGHIEEAIKQLNTALRQEPRSSEPNHLLAIAYGKQGAVGLSSLYLAEEALQKGDLEFARQAAGRAEAQLKKGTPSNLRAKDILDFVEANSKGGKKRD